ncbi:MAG: hypothetical protein ACRBBN_11585 [Methyloligellaceae bacterium]
MTYSEKDLIEIVDSLHLHEQLHDMLAGTSEYSDLDAIESLDKHSRRLAAMAQRHLDYVIRFNDPGNEEKSQKVGSHIYSNYPDYYQAWQLAGLPGVSLYMLEKLIDDNRK